MRYSVQYEEAVSGEVEVTITTADGEELASTTASSMNEARAWVAEKTAELQGS